MTPDAPASEPSPTPEAPAGPLAPAPPLAAATEPAAASVPAPPEPVAPSPAGARMVGPARVPETQPGERPTVQQLQLALEIEKTRLARERVHLERLRLTAQLRQAGL